MKGYPILFHNTHSENIQLSVDKRKAKRVESFCKGICFGNRAIVPNERVYLKIVEVSANWSGVLRFGYTSHDPMTINGATLPPYACPDLTNKQGYWAKALSERFATEGNVLCFYYTREGDVMYSVNYEEKGVFFSGLPANTNLWPLVDIYGNTMTMEFIDGKQLNNFSTNSGLAQPATPQPAQQPNQAELDLAAHLGGLAFTPQDQQQHPAFSTPQQSTQSGSPRSLQGSMDTTTGLSYELLEHAIHKDVPILHLASNKVFNLMDRQDVSGGMFDGSAVLANLLRLSSDFDKVIPKHGPLAESEHEKLIRFIGDSELYCNLDVTTLPHLQQKFSHMTVVREDRIFLSTIKFRQPFRNIEDYAKLGKNLLLIKEDDEPGKASIVRQSVGSNPVDRVYCIPCTGRPKTAVPFLVKKAGIIFMFVCSEFYLVPKCRPAGDAEIEWRLSFTPLENRLIKETWSDTDRKAYVLLKCLIKTHVDMPKTLTSYHLKICMFLTQSMHLPSDLEMNVTQRLLMAIDFLLHQLVAGVLSLPFVKSTNLFANFSPDILATLTRKVSQCRLMLITFHQFDLYGNHELILHSNANRVITESGHLMREYTGKEVDRAVKEFKFVELKELCFDPETWFYIFESYLYKALQFIGRSEEILVKTTIMQKLATALFMREMIIHALYNEHCFGLDYEADPVICEKFLDIFKNKVFFQTFNGIAFDIKGRLFEENDSKNKDLLCIFERANTYFDTKTKLIEEENNFESTLGLYNLFRSRGFTGEIDIKSVRALKTKKSDLVSIVISRAAYVQIAKDVSKGMFAEMGCLSQDPETILYVYESYLTKEAEEKFPAAINLVQQVMLTEEGKRFFILVLADMLYVANEIPHLLGCHVGKESNMQQSPQFLDTAAITVIQMSYDGVSFTIDVFHPSVQEFRSKYKKEDLMCEAEFGRKIFLQSTTNFLPSRYSIVDVKTIMDCFPEKDINNINIWINIGAFQIQRDGLTMYQFYLK